MSIRYKYDNTSYIDSAIDFWIFNKELAKTNHDFINMSFISKVINFIIILSLRHLVI